MLLHAAPPVCCIPGMLLRTLLVLSLAGLAASCEEQPPPVPASSDPQGKDLVKGAVVAAAEAAGGIRIYKIIHVDDYPDPIGYQLHMIAYDPKVATFQEAAALRKKGGMTVALDWMTVAMAPFLKRDHRVIAVESVTDAERAPYERAKNSRNQ